MTPEELSAEYTAMWKEYPDDMQRLCEVFGKNRYSLFAMFCDEPDRVMDEIKKITLEKSMILQCQMGCPSVN